nr:MAG TPA: hypothetical protein [Caudoviricetes sp.]
MFFSIVTAPSSPLFLYSGVLQRLSNHILFPLLLLLLLS